MKYLVSSVVLIAAGFLIAGSLMGDGLRSTSPAFAQNKQGGPPEWVKHLQDTKKYLPEAVIEHGSGTAKLKASDPRPLRQAIEALNQEYGLRINYEDPPYESDSELIETRDAQWKAAHPNSRPATIPAGGVFESVYDENSAALTTEQELTILRKVIKDYNKSGNPGKFELRTHEGGGNSVVGVGVKDKKGGDRSVLPLLDTAVSIPVEKRSAADALGLIFAQLSEKRHAKVALGWGANNLLPNVDITVGGDEVPARNLLLKIFEGTGRPVVHSLLYFENTNTYFLNVSVAARVMRDNFGKRTLIPLDSAPPVRH